MLFSKVGLLQSASFRGLHGPNFFLHLHEEGAWHGRGNKRGKLHPFHSGPEALSGIRIRTLFIDCKRTFAGKEASIQLLSDREKHLALLERGLCSLNFCTPVGGGIQYRNWMLGAKALNSPRG